MNPRQHLGVSAEELHQVISIFERREVIRHIPRLAAHVGVQREVPFAALDEVPRFWEGQRETAIFIAAGESPRMVPMPVRGDDGIDLISSNSHTLQRVKKTL